MMDYTSTRARSKGAFSTPSCGWGQAEAAAANALSASPPPTTDRVYKMYHQLAEIHAIATMQLTECTHWPRSDPTPSPVWVDTGRQGPNEMPSMTRTTPLPLTDFSPQALLRW
jgi:hypothetical protein